MSTEIINEVAKEGVLGTLGINWRLFIAQLINFIVVLLVLWRWAWRPILKVLHEREKRIEQSVAEAKRIEDEAKLLEEKRIKVMKEAEKKAQAVITEAMAAGDTRKEEILGNARVEAEKILKNGEIQLASEKTKMMAETKAELGELVLLASGKITGQTLAPEAHAKLINQAIEDIKNAKI